MKASQAAQLVRNAIRKTGVNPKGMVSVRNTDYTTEIEVNLRGLTEDQEYEVSAVINSIGDSEFFSWSCM